MMNDSRTKDPGHPMRLSSRTRNNWPHFVKSSRRPGKSPNQSIDLEKAYDRVPRDLLWSVLKEYGINGNHSVFVQCHVRINGSKSDSLLFDKDVYCLHSCSLFLWTGTTPDCVTMGNARVESLLFADDIGWLASSSAGLQRAAAECTMAGMQISTKKTEVMVLSRQKKECAVNVNGTPLDQVEKLKYLGVEFSNDARLDCEIDRRIAAASAILRSLYRSVMTKKEVSRSDP